MVILRAHWLNFKTFTPQTRATVHFLCIKGIDSFIKQAWILLRLNNQTICNPWNNLSCSLRWTVSAVALSHNRRTSLSDAFSPTGNRRGAVQGAGGGLSVMMTSFSFDINATSIWMILCLNQCRSCCSSFLHTAFYHSIRQFLQVITGQFQGSSSCVKGA